MNPKNSQDLFNKIRSQFSNVRLGDENGAATANPDDAVFFEFEFQEDADTFGSVSISIADGENMKVYYNRDLVSKIDEDSRDEWYAFLKELKDFAVEHQLTFDVRDITKNNLTKQDYENLADTNKTVNTDDMSEELNRITKLAGISEGLSGTSKSSFENLDKTKLIIRHKGKVDETVPGARSRQIQSLYIENEDGERFKYPLTHLAGARAMTRHVANGGKPYDEFGQHIVQTSEDIAKLQSFSRYVSNKDQLNDNAGDIIENTKLKLENLREYMRNLSKQSHYESSCKSYKKAEDQVLDDETVNKLREKFTQTNLDSRVEDAFPLISKVISELEATPEEPVQEFDTEKEPKKKKEKPYADAGMEVVKFIANPNSKILLNKALPDEKKLEPLNKSQEEKQMIRVLSDIASRMLTDTPEGDMVANFASRMSDILEKGKDDAFKQKDTVDGPGYSRRNRDIAKALVQKYLGSAGGKYGEPAKEIDPSDFKKKKDIKGKDYTQDPMRPEAAFETWVSNVGEATIKPYVSMYKGDDGKMVYDVLDKDSKSAFKSNDMKTAQEYLSKNYDKLREGEPRDEEDRQEKMKALQDIQMDKHTAKDPELQKELMKRKQELQKSEGMGDKIADMAQSMTKDEFMGKADELGLTPEEAAEHYEKMQGGAHAGKFEGNMFAQAVQKAKAAGMKAGDKFKVGDQEYTLKDAIELAGLQLEDFYSEEEMAYDNQIDRIKNLALYQ